MKRTKRMKNRLLAAREEPMLVAPWKRQMSKTSLTIRPTKKLIRQNATNLSQLVDGIGEDDVPDHPDLDAGHPRKLSSRSGSDVDLSLSGPSGQEDRHSSASSSSKRHRARLKGATHVVAMTQALPDTAMDTMQLWRRWCRKTDQVFSSAPNRSWRPSDAATARKSIRDLEMELSLDRDRLRLMIQQGVHKSKSGLKRTVRHVQTDIDREGLYRYRREMVEDVENRGKRIQQALHDSARARKDLQGCVEALRETMTGEGKKKKAKDKNRRMSWSTERLEAIRKKLEEFILTGTVKD